MTPSLTFVTVCKARLAQLQHTLPGMLAQAQTATIVVDYGCPENTAEWVRTNAPDARVIVAADAGGFSHSRARNLGLAAVETPWVCFLDADVHLSPSFADQLIPLLAENIYFCPERTSEHKYYCPIICTTAVANACQGYDEVYTGWGDEDVDFHNQLQFSNQTEHTFSLEMFEVLSHSNEMRTRFLSQNLTLEDTWTRNRLYRYVKFDLMRLSGQALPRAFREQVFAVIDQTYRKACTSNKPLTVEMTVSESALSFAHNDGSKMTLTTPRIWRWQRKLTYTLEAVESGDSLLNPHSSAPV